MTSPGPYGMTGPHTPSVLHPSVLTFGNAAMTRIAQCWYSDTAHELPEHPSLDGAVTADVCIVGAGITGCTAALALAEQGLSVRVVEAQRIATGASGRSGGQVLHGFPVLLDPATPGMEPGLAQALWDTVAEGVAGLRRRIDTHAIDCGFVSGQVRLARKSREVTALEDISRTWQGFGFTAGQWLDRGDLEKVVKSRRFLAGLRDPLGGHLHPLNYTLGLARAAIQAGAIFHENTPYLRHQDAKEGGVLVQTPFGSIKARWLLIAGNATLWERKQAPGAATMPAYTFVAATEPLGEERVAALLPGNDAIMDMAVVPNHIRRTPDHRLIVGGVASHLKVDPFNMQYVLRDVLDDTFNGFSKVRMTHAWGGPVSVTRNRLPHFGRLGKAVLFAQGFNGQGLALASQAGQMMADVVAGTESRFDLVSRLPHKGFPGGRSIQTPVMLLALTRLKIGDWKRDYDDWKAERAERKAVDAALAQSAVTPKGGQGRGKV